MDAKSLNIVIGAFPYQLYFRYKSFNLKSACNLKSIDSIVLDTCCVSLLKSSSDSGTITLTKTQDLQYMYTAPLSTLLQRNTYLRQADSDQYPEQFQNSEQTTTRSTNIQSNSSTNSRILGQLANRRRSHPMRCYLDGWPCVCVDTL